MKSIYLTIRVSTEEKSKIKELSKGNITRFVLDKIFSETITAKPKPIIAKLPSEEYKPIRKCQFVGCKSYDAYDKMKEGYKFWYCIDHYEKS